MAAVITLDLHESHEGVVGAHCEGCTCGSLHNKQHPDPRTDNRTAFVLAQAEYFDPADLPHANQILSSLGTLGAAGDGAIFECLKKGEITEKQMTRLAKKAALGALHRKFEFDPAESAGGKAFIKETFENLSYPCWRIVGIAIGKLENGPSILEGFISHPERAVRGRAKYSLNRLKGLERENLASPIFAVPFIQNLRHIPNLRGLYYDEPVVENPIPLSQTEGMPTEDSLKVLKKFVLGHPLERTCVQESTPTAEQLEHLMRHPLMNLAVVAWESGALPAAFGLDIQHSSFEEIVKTLQEMHAGRYERSTWFRDNGVATAAFMSSGMLDMARNITGASMRYLSGMDIRLKISEYLYDGHGDAGLYNQEAKIPIKASINPLTGELCDLDHTWHHAQLDALGTLGAQAYEQLNLSWRGCRKDGIHGHDINNFDPHYTPDGHLEHAARALVKALERIDAPNTINKGPWEDKSEWARASCNGAVWWNTRAALAFHREHGFRALGVSSDEYGIPTDPEKRTFEQQLVELNNNARNLVCMRIPDLPGVFAKESNRRPLDSAVVLNRSLYRLPLTRNQDDAILRTFFHNLGAVAAVRWDEDLDDKENLGRGDDPYMGLNHHVHFNNDRGWYFSALDQEGRLSPEWPCIQSWGGIAIAQRILREIDTAPQVAEEDFRYLWRILQRSLACVLYQDSAIELPQTGERVIRRKGTVPEVYFESDYSAVGKKKMARHYEANHYTGLAMAHAPLAQLLVVTYKIRKMLDARKR